MLRDATWFVTADSGGNEWRQTRDGYICKISERQGKPVFWRIVSQETWRIMKDGYADGVWPAILELESGLAAMKLPGDRL